MVRPSPRRRSLRRLAGLGLVDDQNAGRAPGTPGFERAATYVIGRFEALGLKPAGEARPVTGPGARHV